MMRKIFYTAVIASLAIPSAMMAESLCVETNGVKYVFPADKTGDMVFGNGTGLTILGKEFTLVDISSMAVTNESQENNTVSVVYSETGAAVTVDGALAKYLEISIDGANVSIIQGPDVKEDTCGEIIYSLSGSSSNGSFYTEGSYKAEVDLCGLTLTNPSGAPIDIQNGKRIKLSVKEGTENFLTDGASGSQKGCLVCKGHLEIKGKGALTLAANKSHALYAKEYITIKNAAITVTSAVKDGINCNQYFNMESGNVTISGTGDDGIQVSFKDDLDREAEDTGSILISGGKISITTTATAAKAIKADGDIEVTGGEIIAKVEGGAEWDEEDVKTKASSCISADGNMTISGGTLNLHATSSAGKGISVDGDLVISAGDITVQTEGGIFAYINGKEYDNYTGNTDNLDSDLKSSPKGIKADGNITINGGNISVTTKGSGGEGIESKKVMTINDGTINVYTYDDGLNSSSHMYINGGTITAVATNNDALDSNGNLYMNGGYVIALGPGSVEGGIDANTEEGYTVIFTGGTLLAIGGNNSLPTTSESTQPFVSGNLSVAASTEVSLRNGDDVLASFTIPANYSSSQGGMRPAPGGGPGGGGPGGGGPGGNSGSVVITCPGLTSGSSYTMTSGSGSTTATATLTSGGGGRPW